MEKSPYLIYVVFVILFFFPISVVADIRDVRIESNLQFIDSFDFGGNGGELQLNVTNISISSKITSKNLSQIGFFLSTNMLWADECNLDKHIQIYSFDKLSNDTKEFSISMSISENHNYIVYFENCISNHVDVRLHLHLDMHNFDLNGQSIYLSKADILLNKTYVIFSSMLLSMAAIWIFYLIFSWSCRKVRTIHLLIVLAPLGRALALILKVLRNSYILHTGCQRCATSYALLFGYWIFTEMPLALVLTLVCTGWSLVKPKLRLKEGLLLFGVIATGLIVYSVCILFDIYEQFPSTLISYACPNIYIYMAFYFWSTQLFSSIRCYTDFLTEFGRTYGKASVSVKYTALFRSLYVYFFLYFAVKVVILLPLEMITPYVFVVPITMLHELLALAMYGIVAYKVRPEMRSEFDQETDQDFEKAAAKECSQTALHNDRLVFSQDTKT